MKVIEDALAVEAAGAFALLVEAVPPEVTAIIAKRLKIPVLSIGAGPYCDGQLLLDIDLLGRGTVFSPKFVKNFVPQALNAMFREENAIFNLASITRRAFEEYVREVKEGAFPHPETHCYKMHEGELKKLEQELAKKDTKEFLAKCHPGL
jgi:3-methyl-2-oxobutanoate hydroxymethyltransferase